MKRLIFLLLVLLMSACSDSKTISASPATADITDENVTTVTQNGVQYVVVKDESGAEKVLEYMMYMNLINQFGSLNSSHYSTYSQPYYPSRYSAPQRVVVHHHYHNSNAKATSAVKPTVKPKASVPQAPKSTRTWSKQSSGNSSSSKSVTSKSSSRTYGGSSSRSSSSTSRSRR